MAKKEDTKAVAPLEQVPSYLAEYDGPTGAEEMGQYTIIPRLKVKQSSAREKLKSLVDGTVVISGTTQVIAKGSGSEGRSEPFRAVPLFFFPEWITMSDLKDKTSPTILYRTTDEHDPIVAKSRSKDLRTEEYGDNNQFKKSHREVFNFCCVIVGEHEFAGSQVVMTFSKGEHRTGRQWITMLRLRKAPIFGQMFEFTTSMRPGDDGDWWGYDIEPCGWVSGEDFEIFKSLHEDIKSAFEERRLQTAGDDEDESGSANKGEAAEHAGL